jgi:AraC family transcriptional activator of tynA and feaB
MTALQLAFATDGVHPRDRFDLWHDVACRAYAEHECTARSPAKFEGAIRTAQLAQATLSIYENSPMDLWRTARQVELAPSDRVFVCLQLDNTCRIGQLGRETTIAPGQFSIVETNRPYTFTYTQSSGQMVPNVERAELTRRLGSVSSLTALSIEADSAIGGLASGYMQMLPAHAALLSGDAGTHVANQVLDLVAMALGQRAEVGQVKLGSASALTLIRLRSAVEQALPNRDLTCQDVAAVAGISVRYANTLLAKEGTSLERLIKQRRLERCRKALAETSGRPISDIAYSWGFSDVSHFSKAFRSAFGMSPRDYRRGASGAQSPAE